MHGQTSSARAFATAEVAGPPTEDGLHVFAAAGHIKQLASPQRIRQRVIQVSQVVEHLRCTAGVAGSSSGARSAGGTRNRRRRCRPPPAAASARSAPRIAFMDLQTHRAGAPGAWQRTLEATSAASSRWLNSSSS